MESYLEQVKQLETKPELKEKYNEIKLNLLPKVLSWGALNRKRVQNVYTLIDPEIYFVDPELESFKGHLEKDEMLVLLALHLNYYWFSTYDMLKLVELFNFDKSTRELIAMIHIYVFITYYKDEYVEERDIFNAMKDVCLALVLDPENFKSFFNTDNLDKAKGLLDKYQFIL